MSYTISSLTRRSMSQMFHALDRVLEKGEQAAKAAGRPETEYLEARLAADMFPLKTQVQLASEMVRRLADASGLETAALPDADASFADLRARVAAARELLRSLPADRLDRDPDGQIELPMGGGGLRVERARYVQGFILPNFYFHATTAYAILRHLGVPVGKADFLAMTPR